MNRGQLSLKKVTIFSKVSVLVPAFCDKTGCMHGSVWTDCST